MFKVLDKDYDTKIELLKHDREQTGLTLTYLKQQLEAKHKELKRKRRNKKDSKLNLSEDSSADGDDDEEKGMIAGVSNNVSMHQCLFRDPNNPNFAYVVTNDEGVRNMGGQFQLQNVYGLKKTNEDGRFNVQGFYCENFGHRAAECPEKKKN